MAVGTLTPLDGRVEVLHDVTWEAVTEPTELVPGDQVRSDAEGGAQLQLSDTGRIEIGPASRVRMGSAGGAELMLGAVLAEGSGLSVDVGRVTISPLDTSAFRIDRALSTRVGVYSGRARIAAPGGPVTVNSLWQAVVVAQAVPTAATPLRVLPKDPWDRRMLGRAIDVGLSILSLERGVRASVNAQEDSAAAIAEALPAPMAPARVAGLLRAHQLTGSKIFVSLALASQVAKPAGILPVARAIIRRVELGASWIVVVAALDLVRPTLLETVGDILTSIPGLGGGPGGGPSSDPSQPPDDGSPSPDPTDGPTSPPPPPAECAPDDQACEVQ
ncbi:MAG: hypothetical protein WD770_04615, partial [Actinomycetota bacterium]